MRVLRSHFGASRGDDSLSTWTENESQYDVLARTARSTHSEVQTSSQLKENVLNKNEQKNKTLT